MANTPSAQPLIHQVLPETGATRLAGYALLALAGSLIIAVSAQIKVPFYPVPMTMQTLAVFIIAAAYGRTLGVATVLLYLAQGVAGLPVFTGGTGLAYMTGPTGGFLAGFVVAAFIIGSAADRGWTTKPVKMFGANLVGGTLLMAIGFAYLSTLIGAEKAWMFGVQPFMFGELAKMVLAAAFIGATGAALKRR